MENLDEKTNRIIKIIREHADNSIKEYNVKSKKMKAAIFNTASLAYTKGIIDATNYYMDEYCEICGKGCETHLACEKVEELYHKLRDLRL